ncbi:histidinol-phosphate transaminase [Echinimonas agarilytica]|uniref:Histidinol-phosphate aminotransferase n=1 Tax=Echinimonas agarilytica TaxID=1215918 RepID=A0AA42B7B1_9GAMM|nr:histidinol-phosphate transaminase [Echinimonas agarilytica]MCM2679421.1 histidinol-phosphate transaminase [Echinimonas agarilytica]
MSDLATRLIRPELADLVPYESARRLGGDGEIWLNANENPYTHEYQLDCSRFNRYPEFQPPELITRYAEYAGVTAEQLLATRGADEGIELLIRTFCAPNQDQIILCPPTYGMYEISAKTNIVGVTKVPLGDDYQVDVDGILKAVETSKSPVKLVFVCSPNNPTGHDMQPERITALLDALRDEALVVVDEAYIEFSAQASVLNLLSQYPNLVVLRTLSKAFALAGIRCGFTLANAPVIQQLAKVIAPYPVPEPVAQVATEALSKDNISKVQQEVATLNTLRAKFADVFTPLTQVYPSSGNYVLCRVPDALKCMTAMAHAGIILRNQSKQITLQNCIRVTIGTEQEMTRTIAALSQYLKESS